MSEAVPLSSSALRRLPSAPPPRDGTSRRTAPSRRAPVSGRRTTGSWSTRYSTRRTSATWGTCRRRPGRPADPVRPGGRPPLRPRLDRVPAAADGGRTQRDAPGLAVCLTVTHVDGLVLAFPLRLPPLGELPLRAWSTAPRTRSPTPRRSGSRWTPSSTTWCRAGPGTRARPTPRNSRRPRSCAWTLPKCPPRCAPETPTTSLRTWACLTGRASFRSRCTTARLVANHDLAAVRAAPRLPRRTALSRATGCTSASALGRHQRRAGQQVTHVTHPATGGPARQRVGGPDTGPPARRRVGRSRPPPAAARPDHRPPATCRPAPPPPTGPPSPIPAHRSGGPPGPANDHPPGGDGTVPDTGRPARRQGDSRQGGRAGRRQGDPRQGDRAGRRFLRAAMRRPPPRSCAVPPRAWSRRTRGRRRPRAAAASRRRWRLSAAHPAG